MPTGRMQLALGEKELCLAWESVYGCGLQKSTTMRVPTLQMFLWLTPTIVESVIVMVIVYRKLWRELPIFFSYLLFEIGRTCFLFLERSNQATYFYGYWVTEALGCLAAIWVIKELFDNAFHRHLGLRRLGNVLFHWSIALLMVVAVIIAWTSPGADSNRLLAGIYILKRVVTFVETGLLGFLFLFAFTFGIGWQHYATGICLGFGIYGSVELAAITARSIYGHTFNSALNWIMMTANNCCVCIWAAYFIVPARVPTKQHYSDLESRLEEWNEALLELMKR